MGHNIYILKVLSSGSNIVLSGVAPLEIIEMSLELNKVVLSRVLTIVGCKKGSARYLRFRDLGPGLQSRKPGFVWLPKWILKFLSLVHLNSTKTSVVQKGGAPHHWLGDHKSVGK